MLLFKISPLMILGILSVCIGLVLLFIWPTNPNLNVNNAGWQKVYGLILLFISLSFFVVDIVLKLCIGKQVYFNAVELIAAILLIAFFWTRS